MKIVSANYHDRKADKKWLIREEADKLDPNQAVSSVLATGVKFGPSSQSEEGFGCKTVAKCKTATVTDREELPGSIQLTFNGYTTFYETGTKNAVQKCKELLLKPNGSIWAVIK